MKNGIEQKSGDILQTNIGPKERVEKLAFDLVEEKPELFAVTDPLNTKFLTSVSAWTDLCFDDGIIEMHLSITRNKETGELTEEIILRDLNTREALYRLDICSGPDVDKKKKAMDLFSESSQKTPIWILKTMGDTFGTINGTIISRYDNWSETTITTENAEKIIKLGKPKLPAHTRDTLLDLKRRMGKIFPLSD